MDKATFDSLHRKSVGRFTLVMLVLASALALTCIYGLSVAQYPISFTEAYRVLIDHLSGIPPGDSYDAWFKDQIVWEMNIPRILGGLTVGAILSVCGAVMQPVVKNPLADPFTTGISSGALLGVSLFIALGISVLPVSNDVVSLMANAFVFSLIPTAAIAFVAVFKKNMSPSMMILTGIAVMYIFSAFSSLLRYSADADSAHEIFTWTLGSLGRVTWDNVWILVVTAIACFVFGLLVSRTLNILSSGDKVSTSLGINVKRFRIASLVAVAVFTAVSVSFAGTIGFVGLVCPHIARILVGSNNKMTIPCAALVGMLMLVATDALSKVIVPAGLPVGAVTAMIGSPIFIYLLIKQRNSVW